VEADDEKICCATSPRMTWLVIVLAKKHSYLGTSGILRSLGFGEVHSDFDLTDKLWDDKERLLYGETPLFGVFATKF